MERLECVVAALIGPVGEQGVEAGSEGVDERLDQLLTVGAESNEADAAVGIAGTPVNEPSCARAIDEVADVRAVAAQELGDVSDGRRSLDGAEQLGLLGGEPDLAADLRIGIVDGHHQPHQPPRDVSGPLGVRRVAHPQAA
jgi:hypothetical protein